MTVKNLRMATKYSFHVKPQVRRGDQKASGRSEQGAGLEDEFDGNAINQGQTIVIPTKGCEFKYFLLIIFKFLLFYLKKILNFDFYSIYQSNFLRFRKSNFRYISYLNLADFLIIFFTKLNFLKLVFCFTFEIF